MRFKTRVKAAVATALAVVTLAGVPLAVYAGYAPADRPTYQCITPTNCPGANHVVFNSFTNAPNYGDERSFFDGKDAHDTSANGYLDTIPVRDGQLLTLRVYVHNNANPNAIGEAAATAHDTSLQVLLPTSERTVNRAAANLSASNANPGTVSDTVNFTGDAPFTISFYRNDPVQITYRPNGTGAVVTRNVNTASFSGDHTMNAPLGAWKGCFEYSALITMTVKVKMKPTPVKPTYACDMLNIVADVNRRVKINEFKTSTSNGAVFKHAVINWGDNSAPLTTNNVVGQSHQYAADGTYTITATAYFTVNGKEVSATSADCAKQVTFKGNVPTPPVPPVTPPSGKLPSTGPGEVAGLFALVSAAGAIAHRWFLGRRFGNQ